MGPMVQPYNGMAWLPFGLPPNFLPLTNFCCHFNGIKVLGVPFGYMFFTSSFLQDTLEENVCHIDMISTLRDV
jgi:hypothetical protein